MIKKAPTGAVRRELASARKELKRLEKNYPNVSSTIANIQDQFQALRDIITAFQLQSAKRKK